MTTGDEPLHNDFWVLGLTPAASRMDIERAGQKLLAQLTIGAASARTYLTPLGPRPLDEALVRSALAALRDPERRVLLELWADAQPGEDVPDAPAAWSTALRSTGWNR